MERAAFWEAEEERALTYEAILASLSREFGHKVSAARIAQRPNDQTCFVCKAEFGRDARVLVLSLPHFSLECCLLRMGCRGRADDAKAEERKAVEKSVVTIPEGDEA